MTYFKDLSEYSYHGSVFYRPGTKNIGWLGSGHEFDVMEPSEEILSLVWDYCMISVAQMRGIHECEFCPSGDWEIGEKNGQKLILGAAEIRVFSKSGVIYAAPTLIYHYISTHHYKPPDEFLQALRESPRPPSDLYFEKLDEFGLEWNETSTPGPIYRRFRISDLPLKPSG